MPRCHRRLLGLLLLTAPLALAAQTAPGAPTSRVMSIWMETVKVGKIDAHNAHEVAWARAIAATRAPTPALAMIATSGASQNWYITSYRDWADMEQTQKTNSEHVTRASVNRQFSSAESEFLSDARGMVLTLRDDLSYGPIPDLSHFRYYVVTQVSVRPGHLTEFEENRQTVKAAFERNHRDDGYTVWQVATGEPSGTYFIFTPVKSLAELDQNEAFRGTAYTASLSDPKMKARLEANQAAAISSMETNVFAFAPQQSLVPLSWAANDPGFWARTVPTVRKVP